MVLDLLVTSLSVLRLLHYGCILLALLGPSGGCAGLWGTLGVFGGVLDVCVGLFLLVAAVVVAAGCFVGCSFSSGANLLCTLPPDHMHFYPWVVSHPS